MIDPYGLSGDAPALPVLMISSGSIMIDPVRFVDLQVALERSGFYIEVRGIFNR